MSKEKNDLTLKIFAFIIAVVLWSYVMSEVNPDVSEDYRNINLTLNNVETLDRQGLIIMEPKEITISVRVTGKKSDMANFSSKSIKAQVDLSGYSEGQKKVPVNVTLDQLSNVKIASYEPREVLFTFDRLITKEKAVTVRTTKDLDSGYILGDIGIKPQIVLLKGPRSWINEVSEVVAIVDLKGRKEGGNMTLPIKLLDDQGNDVRGVEKEPNAIDVNIAILRTVKIPIELQIENQLPNNYEITEVAINPSSIEIKGNKDILKFISIQTKPINIKDLIRDTKMEVELDLPEGVQLLNPNEKVNVSLKIEESGIKAFSYTLNELKIENLDSNLSIDESDYLKDIVITLKGNKESVEKLTKDDLQLYIDLSTFKEGVNQVYINFHVPTGMTVQEIMPQPIEIRLIKD